MPTNWKQIYAKKKQATETLLKELPNLKNDSGIYILARDDESGLKYAYVGQAKHLIDRLVSHLLGYSQRIDISLRKRGFWRPIDRPYGWILNVMYAKESELDNLEKNTIQEIASRGYQLYNKTSGGQGEGKLGINENKSPKGYRDGLEQGRKNALKEIKEFFDKYLIFAVKQDPSCYKVNGELKEIYIKKYQEFKELLDL